LSFRSNDREIAAVGAPSIAIAIGALALAAILQATVVHALAIRNAVPSLVIIVVVLYALRVGTKRGLLIGALGGLFEDALTGGTGGGWTLSTALVAVVAGAASRFFFSDSTPALIIAVALGSLLRSAFFWTIMKFGGYPSGLASAHLHTAILQALYTTLVAIPIILFLDRSKERPVKRIPLRDFRST
jgi:rod shape-determining protein MreD